MGMGIDQHHLKINVKYQIPNVKGMSTSKFQMILQEIPFEIWHSFEL
jgi:hypothetical protein